jgi:hypothetical protein
MDQQEVDKLVSDIQEYLRSVAIDGPDRAAGSLEQSGEAEAGLFMTSGSRKKMRRFMKLSRAASVAVEILTIALFVTGLLVPFSSWSRTAMFLMGTLLFGIFTMSLLFGLQARIRLLCRIEANTREIALNKARIANFLENIRIE